MTRTISHPVLGINERIDRNASAPAGELFIVGGGGTPPSQVLRSALTAAGGRDARVVIFPQASELEETGERNAAMWRAAGARNVKVCDPLGRHDPKTLENVRRATLIWMPGGDQSRLYEALRSAGLVATFQETYQAGAVVGGTSAGAAVMSRRMITGSKSNGTGLGLWPRVIVDQHFRQRKRLDRLADRIWDRPDHVGVGIDERTAVRLTEGSTAEVLGQGTVTVVDFRSLPPGTSKDDALKLGVRVFRAGESFTLDPRK